MFTTLRFLSRPLIAALLLSLAGCDAIAEAVEPAPEQAQPRIAPTQRPLAAVAPEVLETATAAEMLERMKAGTRVEPDRRFTTAIKRIDAFFAGDATPSPMVVFEGGAWRVRLGDQELGRVSELPSFDELFALVQARAKARWKASGLTATAEARTDTGTALVGAADTVRVLKEADAQWKTGVRSAATAQRAAQAAVLLAVSLVDTLGVGDSVAAHAIATLATAEAIAGAPMPREQALLARALDYAASAEKLAASLDAKDAVRALVTDEVDELARSSNPTEVMLAATSIGKTASADEYTSFIAAQRERGASSFPVLRMLAGQDFGTFDEYRMAASATIALRELAGESVVLPQGVARSPEGVVASKLDGAQVAKALDLPMSEIIPRTDGLVASVRKLTGGPFFAPDALADYYAAQVLSSMNSVLLFHLDTRGANQEADAVLASLGAGEGALGKEFERYAAQAIRAERRTLELEALIEEIRTLNVLGIGAFNRLAEPVFEQGRFSPALEQLASALRMRCDSRMQCRSLLAEVANRGVNDLVAYERFRTSMIAEAPRNYPSMRLDHVRLARDKTAYLAALVDPTVVANKRAWFLENASDWLSAVEVKKAFVRVLEQAVGDENRAVRLHFARWLLAQKDPKAAIQIIDGYLAQDPKLDTHPLHRIEMQTLRAKALQDAGKLEKAWTEVEPLIDTMYGGALWRAALLQAARNNHEQAIAIGQRRLDRYKDASSVSLLCAVYWLADKPEEAAVLLEKWSNRLTISDWGDISKAFKLAFADRPADLAEAAFKTLVGKNLDAMGVRLIVQNSDISAEHRFRTYSLIPGEGFIRHLDGSRLYRYMKTWKGETEALAMLSQKLPEGTRDPLAQHGYTAKVYELIWTFVPDLPPEHQFAPFLGLMRTAAYLQTKERPAAWREKLDKYYATQPKHPHDMMGQYLLGKVDAETLWKASVGEDHRPEATWVLGLRAEMEGDIETAIHWYRATMQGGRQNSGEVQWSSDSLHSFRNATKSLTVLSAEAKAKRL